MGRLGVIGVRGLSERERAWAADVVAQFVGLADWVVTANEEYGPVVRECVAALEGADDDVEEMKTDLGVAARCTLLLVFVRVRDRETIPDPLARVVSWAEADGKPVTVHRL